MVGPVGFEPTCPKTARFKLALYANSKHDPMTAFTESILREIVPTCSSYADVIRAVGLIPAGGNYSTVKRKCQEYGIDTSHFVGQGWNKGERYRPIRELIPLVEIMVEDSSYNGSHLSKRLRREKILPERCSRCKRTEWEGQPITLELDHINGNNRDHRFENLRLLCPNCHSLTVTWRRRK